MSEPSKAVFLSYASQDAGAATKICEVLRVAGVEVWFDQSELVGGDAWDAKIKKQIKECALFVPVISANTNARREGYFRREWKVAVDRTHDMDEGLPFLLPVVIDGTTDTGAFVPEKFREVQWTRLPGGETPAAFGGRVKKLLAGESPAEVVRSSPARPARPSKWWWALPMFGVTMALVLVMKESRQEPGPVVTALVPGSEARRLADQARELLLKPSGGPGKYETAVLLCDRALALDPTDAEVWAIASQVDTNMVRQAFDPSEKRIASAQGKAAKAINLAPRSFEARLALAVFQAMIGGQPVAAQGESALRALHAENPRELRALYALVVLLRNQGRGEEAVAFAEEAIRLPGGAVTGLTQKAWALRGLWRFDEADAALDQSIAIEPIAGNVGLKVFLDLSWRGDPDRALATMRKLPADELTMDVGVAAAVRLYRWRREPAELLKFLEAVPRDWLPWSIVGPKAALTGDANAELNRPAAARAEWQTALALVAQRLAATPNDRNLLEWKAYLEASLGETALAQATWQRSREAPSQLLALLNVEKIHRVATPDQVIEELEQRVKGVIGNLVQRRDSFSAFISAAELRLNPAWDDIRNLPRFQALQARLDADPRFSPAAKATAAGTTTAPVAVADKSVAVLAFANLSDDKTNEYFSDGISEELLNVLAKIPNLKVSARTSAFYFKGKEVPVPEIAKQLGVAYVVEGSVRKQGSQVRITAQLIRASDGFQVWSSDNLDRELKDIFAVQDEIAGLIARNLSLKMGVASSLARREVNPEAHRLVLEGRHFWNLRTDDGFARAEAAFAKAIELDPEFAQAHAGLADVLVTKAIFQCYAGANSAVTPQARVEAEQALALDPNLAEAHPSLGVILTNEGRFREAEQEFKKALALNPNYALAHHWYALLLEIQGRLDTALVEIDEAFRLDPLSLSATATRGRFLLAGQNHAAALAAFDRALALRSNFQFVLGERALCLMALGRREEALTTARAVESAPAMEQRWFIDPEAIQVLHQAGREQEAADHAARMLPLFPADSYLRGMLLAAQGRWAEAEPYLERTPVAQQAVFYWNPIWDRWREDPRFHRLLEKLGRANEYGVARETLARLLHGQVATK